MKNSKLNRRNDQDANISGKAFKIPMNGWIG